MARLLSVNAGLPRDIRWNGKSVHTAIWKAPVPGRRMVRRLNIDGDGQGDLVGHGGEHRAVFVYQIEAYRYWEEQLRRTSSAKTSPSKACPTTKCASATATRSAAPCSK